MYHLTATMLMKMHPTSSAMKGESLVNMHPMRREKLVQEQVSSSIQGVPGAG